MIVGIVAVAMLYAAHASVAGMHAASSADASSRAAMPQLTVDRLDWMAGCWRGEYGNGRVYEEVWLAPRAGTLLGVSRTTRGDATVAWEHLRIAVEEGRLVYHAQPSGQPPATFSADDVGNREVTFANPAHDFPQRIRYRAAAPDSLIARIEGERNGQPRGSDFPMRRVSCDG